jgi:large subunit ribosomal protein L25
MADKIKLNAQKRDMLGRKVKKLRAQDLIPANVFGSKIKSQALTIKTEEFKKVLLEAGESSIVELLIEGEKESRPVLIRGSQTHPVSREILHIDLRQVDLKEKIKALIDVILKGESPAQTQGALIITLKNQVEVEALPTDLPEQLEIDISKLKEVNDFLTVAELKVDKAKVEILNQADEILVRAEAPKEEEEEPVETTEEAEETAEGTEEGETDKAEEGEEKKEKEKTGDQDKKDKPAKKEAKKE